MISNDRRKKFKFLLHLQKRLRQKKKKQKNDEFESFYDVVTLVANFFCILLSLESIISFQQFV